LSGSHRDLLRIAGLSRPLGPARRPEESPSFPDPAGIFLLPVPVASGSVTAGIGGGVKSGRLPERRFGAGRAASLVRMGDERNCDDEHTGKTACRRETKYAKAVAA